MAFLMREREGETEGARESNIAVPVFQETTFTADLFLFSFLFSSRGVFFSPCEIMSALSHLQSPFVSPDLLRILIVQEHLLSKAGK